MPQWSPVNEPSKILSFLILWMMSVLPVLYLSFRHWADDSLDTFMPQVFVFLVLSFIIQTALNAVSMGFDLMKIPHSAVMPFVWALPWLALTTTFRNAYATAKQCNSLLIIVTPIALVFHIAYLLLPAFALAYGGTIAATATLYILVALGYGSALWRLNRNIKFV